MTHERYSRSVAITQQVPTVLPIVGGIGISETERRAAMLNSLAVTYLETQAETDFNALYSEFNRVYSGKYPCIANQFNNDVHSVQAAYEDTLLKVLSSFKPGKGVFTHYLNRALRNTRADLQQAYNKQRAEIPASQNVTEEFTGNIFNLIPDGVDVEAEVIDRLFSQSFKRRLFQKAAEEGLRTLQAVRMIYEGETVHSTAQQLGVCHKTVRRRLQKILREAV